MKGRAMSSSPDARGVRAGQLGDSSLKRLRALINVELLRSEIERLLYDAGRDVSEWHDWPPALAQVRISSADTKWRTMSTSPERQVKQLARYCVEYSFRPEEMCFEAQSASLSASKPRRLFEEYYQRLERRELDVVAVITYNIDRFTRDRYIGEKWLRMLKLRGIDLHEADEMDPPLPLAEREEDYVTKLHGAWRESARASKRIRDARRDRERNGRLLNSVDRYGHRPVYETRDGRRVEARAEIVPKEADVLREATRRLHAGEKLYPILVDFNERDLRGRQGGLWSHYTLRELLISPRLAGLQRASDGGMLRRDIEPIISEDEWRRNCELLKRSPRGPRATREYSVSGMSRCAACGSNLVRTSPAGRSGRAYYRCSRPDLRNRRRCFSEHPGGRCTCGNEFHAYRDTEVLDSFLLDVALAVVEAQFVAGADGSVASSELVSVRSEQVHAELAELDAQRRELARRERRRLITAQEAEVELRPIVARGDECRSELARLQRHVSSEPALKGSGARARANADKAFARRLVEQVIDHCVVHPRRVSDGEPFAGIDIVFVAPYSLSENDLDALRERLDSAKQRQTRLAMPWPAQSTRADGEDAFKLYEQGLTTADIARSFTSLGRPTQRGDSLWAPDEIEDMLLRICDERNIAYEHRRNSRGRWSYEARTLVYELCSNPMRTFSAVAADLRQMAVQPPPGVAWTWESVRDCYVDECVRRDESLVSRLLSDA
jgi:hypothetical protein